MKNGIIVTAIFFTFVLSGFAVPPVTGSGTLDVTAQVTGSLNLIFTTDAAGFTVTGTGTSAASMALGTVQMYGGTVPTNVTRTLNGTTAFTLSTPIDLEVDLANTTSDTYSLSAALTTADAVNTWKFNAVTVTSTPGVVDASGGYGTPNAYTLALTIPSGEAANSLSNTLNFTATAN